MNGNQPGARRRLLLAVAGLAVIVFAGACGGGDDDSTNGGDGKTAVPTASATAKPLGPEELGNQVAADYFTMLGEAAALLASQPTAEVLRPKLTALKEKYIAVFVAYGYQREAMSTADRDKVDAALRKAVFAAPATVVAPLNEATTRFQKTDPDLAQTVVSLNILTQYAAFDLLKKQEPKEAERLGIK
ncbi:MAG: hypothetical protein HY875_14250 [Chloroflexi bacterium]|nr:hypothetical protein [Chloroflexota bacterium]